MDRFKYVGHALILFIIALYEVAAETTQDVDELTQINGVTWVAVACISVVVVAFIISLCGGCTPMEVGSDDHAASRGSKRSQNMSCDTDANTGVLQSRTTLPNDPCLSQTAPLLPYTLRPASAPTAPGTSTGQDPVGSSQTGYQPQPVNGYQQQSVGGYGQQSGGQSQQQSSGMYQQQVPSQLERTQLFLGGHLAASQSAAYVIGEEEASEYRRQLSNRRTRPGANRHVSETEPPPPDYDDAIRS